MSSWRRRPLENRRAALDGVLAPGKNGLAGFRGLHLQLFLAEQVAHEFAGGCLQRAVPAILVDEAAQFIGQGKIERAGHRRSSPGSSFVQPHSQGHFLSIFAKLRSSRRAGRPLARVLACGQSHRRTVIGCRPDYTFEVQAADGGSPWNRLVLHGKIELSPLVLLAAAFS